MLTNNTAMVGGRSENSGHSSHLPSGLPIGLPTGDIVRVVSFESAVRRCLEENIEQLLTNGSPYARMASESEKKEIHLASHLVELPDASWTELSNVLHNDMDYSRRIGDKFDIPDFNHLTATFIATYMIAREMGYERKQSIEIATGGFVHDIKKHPGISHKPDKLTEAEWIIDELHPIEGYRLFVKAGETRQAVLDSIYLHQKWIRINPGSIRRSYPRDSPDPTIYASITAGGDVGDVLLRGRNYRKDEEARNGSVRKTISELERESLESEDGLHFERRVVEAYVPILRKAL